ncbi:MAG: hypothetical protein NTZ90_10775 [Proteobacteria bacterium]|nr:hypothetical protein [Pseudomonadota bacterium]
MTHIICKIPPVHAWGLSSAACGTLDDFGLWVIAGLATVLAIRYPRSTIKILTLPALACCSLYRHYRRKYLRHEFYELHNYASQREVLSPKNAAVREWIYPIAKWESITVGRSKVRKATLRVTFPHGVKRQKLRDELDLWSGSWGTWFYDCTADDKDPRVFRFHAATVPDAVDLSAMPRDMEPFTAFLGISERLTPLTRRLADDPAAAIIAPSGSGKSAWIAMYLTSVVKTTPSVRIVVISTKHLALFRRIPGTQVFNAFKPSDMASLQQLLAELNATAAALLDLLDAHHVEHIEDLYRLGIVSPETHPRWVLVCDEAKDYLRPLRRPTQEKPWNDLEQTYAQLIDTVGAWFRKYRAISRHCLIGVQDPAAGALAIELDGLSWKVVGRYRDAMARTLVQSDRAAREPMPRGVFFLHENNQLIKFRGPYNPDFFKGGDHHGKGQGKKGSP